MTDKKVLVESTDVIDRHAAVMEVSGRERVDVPLSAGQLQDCVVHCRLTFSTVVLFRIAHHLI